MNLSCNSEALASELLEFVIKTLHITQESKGEEAPG